MEQPPDDPIGEAEVFKCPGCGEDIQVERYPTAHLNTCPYCSEQMLIPALDGSTDLPEESEEEQKPSSDDELDGLRVKALAHGRRAEMRARTYCQLASVGCLYIAYLAGAHVVKAFKTGRPWTVLVFIWAACVLISLACAVYMFQRARAHERRSREPMLQDPDTPPDFAPLSDGSQYSSNLQHMNEPARQDDEQSDGDPA